MATKHLTGQQAIDKVLDGAQAFWTEHHDHPKRVYLPTILAIYLQKATPNFPTKMASDVIFKGVKAFEKHRLFGMKVELTMEKELRFE